MAKGIGILSLGVSMLGWLAAWGANVAPSQKAANDSAPTSPADRLVHEALAAELAGDNARRNELLAQALKEDLNCRAARWQSGYVNLDGKWLTTAEAAQKFASDHVLAEYRRRRDAAARAGLFARGDADMTRGYTYGAQNESRGTSVETHHSDGLSASGIAAHVDLARWCRKNRLLDEERAHWTQVLLEDPKNREAESRLDMRWYGHSLLTETQIDAIKKQHAIEEKQLADWKAIVTTWRKALDSGSNSERIQAVVEMNDIKDPTVIPALEWASSSDSPRPPAGRDSTTAFQRQAVALLSRLPAQRATYSLTLQAVLARQSEVQQAAMDALKMRPLHDFVPVLLAGLANPIQFEYSLSLDTSYGTVTYEAVVSQEGHDKISEKQRSELVAGSSITVTYYPNRSQTQRWGIAATPGVADKASTAADRLRDSQAFAMAIDRKNAQIADMNGRIDLVLGSLTGLHSQVKTPLPNDSDAIPDSAVTPPTSSAANYWWTWWDKYNEKDIPYRKPIEMAQYSNSTVYSQRYEVNPSCFSAGTEVLTAIGPVAIERLQIGDRVLAQDVDSGDLEYKPVLGTTVRPPVEMVLMTTSNGDLRTTRGHPFWIVGRGWRMAKELQVGDHIHCLDGSATVTAAHAEPPEKAYNLIVADFGTYFVGDGKILVHDNTVRLPTPAMLPGFVKADR
jgi:hypothetical protein